MLLGSREYDQAIEHLRLATELDPNFNAAHFELGYVYEYKGMFQEAIAEQQKALDLPPRTRTSKPRRIWHMRMRFRGGKPRRKSCWPNSRLLPAIRTRTISSQVCASG
jgi:tetratricopeptide (TPR) repeat protein